MNNEKNLIDEHHSVQQQIPYQFTIDKRNFFLIGDIYMS